MKRKLRLEDLAVETFATTPAALTARGTVRAFGHLTQIPCATYVDPTCAQDCGPSLELSCAGTCDLLCAVDTIDLCDATNFGATCPADCGPTLEMSCGGSCGNYGGPCVGSYDAVSCSGVDVCY